MGQETRGAAVKKHIKSGWDGYRTICVPVAASATQVEETRQAFYAGAAVLLKVLIAGLSKGRKSKPEDLQMLADVQRELEEFGHTLDAKVLGELDGRAH